MPLHVMIITPERTVLDVEGAEHVLLPGTDGELGVLPGHVPMVASLYVGQIEVDLPEHSVRLSASGGFAEVCFDRVLVLAETAERADEIDVERARMALNGAMMILDHSRPRRTKVPQAQSQLFQELLEDKEIFVTRLTSTGNFETLKNNPFQPVPKLAVCYFLQKLF